MKIVGISARIINFSTLAGIKNNLNWITALNVGNKY
jgi:hypothetical protein